MSYFESIPNDLITLIIEKVEDSDHIPNFSEFLKNISIPVNKLFKDAVRRRLSDIFGPIDEKLLKPDYSYDQIYIDIFSNEGFDWISSLYQEDPDSLINKDLENSLNDLYSDAEELFIILANILDKLVSPDFFVSAINSDIQKIFHIEDMKSIYMNNLDRVENTDEVYRDVIRDWLWYYGMREEQEAENVFTMVLTIIVDDIGIKNFKPMVQQVISKYHRSFDQMRKFFNMDFIKRLGK